MRKPEMRARVDALRDTWVSQHPSWATGSCESIDRLYFADTILRAGPKCYMRISFCGDTRQDRVTIDIAWGTGTEPARGYFGPGEGTLALVRNATNPIDFEKKVYSRPLGALIRGGLV